VKERFVVSGRHDDKGKALVSELEELGAEATFIKSDVRYEDEGALAIAVKCYYLVQFLHLQEDFPASQQMGDRLADPGERVDGGHGHV
jgi:hypothetical protein